MMAIEKVYEEYLHYVLKADKNNGYQVILNALESEVPVIEIYQHVFYPVMVKTGELWEENIIDVAQEHLVTAITQNIISALYPILFKQLKDREEIKGKILMACPGNELHELGSRMLSDLWELEGWDVTFLGSNIPAQFIADQLAAGKHDILSLSCALSFNVRYVKETIDLVHDTLHYRKPVIVGGRVFNIDPGLKDYVGADFHGADYYAALKILEELYAKQDH